MQEYPSATTIADWPAWTAGLIQNKKSMKTNPIVQMCNGRRMMKPPCVMKFGNLYFFFHRLAGASSL
jgi:hypothetical protein